MDWSDLPIRRLARTAGAILGGLVGTIALAIVLLAASQPVRRWLFDALYLSLGPWSAEETATVVTFVLAGLGATAVSTTLGAGITHGGHAARRTGGLLASLVGVIGLALLASAMLGWTGWLAAVTAVAGFVVAVPLTIRWVGAWPAGIATFVGGVPPLVVLLLLLGFGLGWGGGYDLVAREVPNASDSEAVATFEAVPQVRADLLTTGPASDSRGYCERNPAGGRTCYLPLRGYQHEATAARFLARHGVRCPYRGGPTDGDRNRWFLAANNGTVYEVGCLAYGD